MGSLLGTILHGCAVLLWVADMLRVSWSVGLFSDRLSCLSFLALCTGITTFVCELLLSPSPLSLSYCSQTVGNTLAAGSVSGAVRNGVAMWYVMSMVSAAVEDSTLVVMG